jgi:hypothetical protein
MIRTAVTITQTGNVATGPCVIYGILNSGAAGTIALRDGGAGGTLVGTLVLAADQYLPLPSGWQFRTSLHATLTTADQASFLLGS